VRASACSGCEDGTLRVIPAKAGTQEHRGSQTGGNTITAGDIFASLGPGFRRDDGMIRSLLIANREIVWRIIRAEFELAPILNAPIPERARYGTFRMPWDDPLCE
jgi:hypothetical protein